MQHHTPFYYHNGLTPDQLQFFEKNGYLHFKSFLPSETVHELIREIEKVEAFLIRNQQDKVNGIPLKFGINTNGQKFIQRIAFASRYSDMLHHFLQHERFQQLIALLGHHEGRIGEFEKDGLVVNHYLNTPGSEYKQLGWHTDSPRDLFLGSRIKPMLNVGLHLDDCPIQNGGLRLLSGTHKQGMLRLLFRKKYFIDNKPDRNEIGFDITAGDLTIHDGRLWHRVQQSPLQGEASRRRVMYIPIVTGAYQPKNHLSRTPLYHSIGSLLNRKSRLAYALTNQQQAATTNVLKQTSK